MNCRLLNWLIAAAIAGIAEMASAQTRLATISSDGISLTGRNTVELIASDSNMASRLLTCKRTTLVLDGLQASQEPGVSFQIVLNHREDDLQTPRKQPGYVGDVNFFGIAQRRGGTKLSFSLDAVVERLARAKRSAGTWTVSIFSVHGPARDSAPRIARIAIWCAD